MTVALVFVLLLIIGTPIGFSVGIAGVVGLISMGGERFLAVAPGKVFAGLDAFPFLAMPFFILAGEIMNHIGITDRLIKLAEVLVGRFRGGLAHANMLASVFFAGLTGSATADAAAFDRTLVPAMERAGYKRDYACAVTAAGSIIGPTIPPSGLMVVYGSLMGVSISGLFAAGILPGLAICVICMAVIALGGKRENLPVAERGATLGEIWRTFVSSLTALAMPAIILGGILGGIVTPTEAAAIAVAYALFIGAFVYRRLTFGALLEMLISTARITGVIFVIIAFAGILGWWMSFERIPQAIAEAVLATSEEPLGGDADHHRGAAGDRHGDGHHRYPDPACPGAGAADRDHRARSDPRRNHLHLVAQHLADDTAGGGLPLRAVLGDGREDRTDHRQARALPAGRARRADRLRLLGGRGAAAAPPAGLHQLRIQQGGKTNENHAENPVPRHRACIRGGPGGNHRLRP
ncbi:TRAP transporter large permease [Ponticoccus litoralis]|uniref:TRAP transporter large permease n=1 Tax=Ponticoccus litoralis TaxID=422297 RepID=UPI003D2F000A